MLPAVIKALFTASLPLATKCQQPSPAISRRSLIYEPHDPKRRSLQFKLKQLKCDV